MNDKVNLFYILKVIVLSLLFYGAIMFENAKGQRLYLLVIFFCLYLIVGITKRKIFKNNKLLAFSFVFDLGLIYILESYSRFQINYFLHSFYILLLIEIALILDRKSSLLIGIATIIVSTIKYSLLVYYIPNLDKISQMAFFTIIGVFVLIITAFAQYYREEEKKKDELYKELLKTHRRLKEYSNEVEKLTKIEERNHIAREIHDTLGHSMTGIIMQMEMAYHIIDDNIEDAKELLFKAKESSREGLRRVRDVVETLRPNDKSSRGVTSLKELVEDFSESTGVNISLDIKGDVVKLSPTVNLAIYRLIQEAMTNAVRHGKAAKIDITLSYIKEGIEFKICDDGSGCIDIKEGYGLKGMKERIDLLNGQLKVQSVNGFSIEGFIPIGGGVSD